MKTKLIMKLIAQAEAGRFGDNFVEIGKGARVELEKIQSDTEDLIFTEFNGFLSRDTIKKIMEDK